MSLPGNKALVRRFIKEVQNRPTGSCVSPTLARAIVCCFAIERFPLCQFR